jgi:UDP-2,3-diacylglucosamine pyrophosphatase LpxH
MREIIPEPVKIEYLEEKTIVVVSDVHLGYRDKTDKNKMHSSKDDFKEFTLKLISKEIPCDYFIICGDFLDMWRRDLVGVVMENADIFNTLNDLQNSGVDVKFVVGNHDYYLRNIIEKHYGYNFSFYKGLTLKDEKNNEEYVFLHGDEFDTLQDPFYYDILCYSNDDAGEFMESAWKFFLQNRSLFKRIWDLITKGRIEEAIKKLINPAEYRFTDEMMVAYANGYKLPAKIPDTEKKAMNYSKEQEKILVFGHTHRPFVHVDKEEKIRIANTGTWVNKHTIKNTFVTLSKKEMKISKFDSGSVTDLDKKEL